MLPRGHTAREHPDTRTRSVQGRGPSLLEKRRRLFDHRYGSILGRMKLGGVGVVEKNDAMMQETNELLCIRR